MKQRITIQKPLLLLAQTTEHYRQTPDKTAASWGSNQPRQRSKGWHIKYYMAHILCFGSGFKQPQILPFSHWSNSHCHRLSWTLLANQPNKRADSKAERLLSYEAKCLKLSKQTYKSPIENPETHWRTLAADADFNRHTPLNPEVFEGYLLCKKVWVPQRD